MLRRVALVRTDVSEELSASFTRVTRIGKLGTTLAVTSNRLLADPCEKYNAGMASSGILRRVALVRIDVSEDLRACFITVTRIGELGTTQAVSSNRRTLRRNTTMRRFLVTARVFHSSQILVTLMMEAPSSFETSILTRAIRRDIPDDAILHSHRRENLKSYIRRSELFSVQFV
jgi:hypothetical protein